MSATDCTGVEIETLMEIRTAKAGQMFQEVPSQERRRISVASNVRAVRAPTAALPAMLAEVMNTTEKGVRICWSQFPSSSAAGPPGLAAA